MSHLCLVIRTRLAFFRQLYPKSITNIKEKKIRSTKKRTFRRACKGYSIDNHNRLWQRSKFRDFFDGIIKKDKFLIITKLEFYDIIYILHDKNGHKE